MGKSTVSQGAEEVEREERKPKSKCFIQFRPYSNYDGEFGFDWMRMGDTKRKGDNWFGKIMGKYYENDNVSIFQNSNTWNNNFVKELKMYDDKLKSYKNFSRYNGAAYLYLIPTLTILKGVKATFDLHFEIKESPNKLTLEFEDKDATKYFSVNKTEITDIRNGKYILKDEISITCNQEFSTVQFLNIIADGKKCGALRIHPNTDVYKRKINVVMISVDTDINGLKMMGKPILKGEDFFKKCLNQALVTPNIVKENKHLDCTSSLFGLINSFRNTFCTKKDNNIYYLDYAKCNTLRTYLEEKLKSTFGDKYKDYYTLFFIPNKCYSGSSSTINGFSYFNSTFGVYFEGHNRGTLSHETFHAMNLPHTFSGLMSENAFYTYQAGQTDNIMDYSHWASFGSIDRKVLFLWQWKMLNPKIIIK